MSGADQCPSDRTYTQLIQILSTEEAADVVNETFADMIFR